MQAPRGPAVASDMSRVRTFALVAVTGAVVAVGWLLLSDPMVDEAARDGLADADADEDAERRRLAGDRRREARSGRSVAAHPDTRLAREADEVLAPPSGEGELGPLGPEESRAGFEHVMSRVDEVVAGRTRLSPDQWEDLYRAANDAFAALSMHLNANDPAEAQELEEAHKRLRASLESVRVRGRKRIP